jgi:hypothetical protein
MISKASGTFLHPLILSGSFMFKGMLHVQGQSLPAVRCSLPRVCQCMCRYAGVEKNRISIAVGLSKCIKREEYPPAFKMLYKAARLFPEGGISKLRFKFLFFFTLCAGRFMRRPVKRKKPPFQWAASWLYITIA